MLRRSALLLAFGVLLLMPGFSPARPNLPLPTVGAAHLERCDFTVCGNPNVDTYLGRFSFMGALSLDQGSYLGTFGVDFSSRKECPPGLPLVSCRYRIISSQVHRATFFIPTVNGPVLNDIPISPGDLLPSLTFGPGISGPCSGVIRESGLARLKCSFKTSTGLSGTRVLSVVAVPDLYNEPCNFLCAMPQFSEQYVGVYSSGKLPA